MGWLRTFGKFGPMTALDVRPNILLISLPTILAGRHLSIAASGYVLALMAIVAFSVRRTYTDRMTLAWAGAILPAAGLSIAFRPNYSDTVISSLFFVAACFAITCVVSLSTSKLSALVSLLDGVGLFLVASVVLWLMGFVGTQERTAGLANSLTGGLRVIFPLSASLAATPGMAAVYIAAIGPILILSRRYRVPRLAALVCAIFIIVLSDSRVSLIAAVALGACVLLIPQRLRVATPWLVGVLLVFPMIYGYIEVALGRIITAASSYAPSIVRSQRDAVTLNGRDYVWSQSLDFYRDRVDWVHQMFGFGAFGHVKSGVSGYYTDRFTNLANDLRFSYDIRATTPHSSTLQILFDGGWLVVSILVVTIVYMAWVLSQRFSLVNSVGSVMLAALVFVGTTEVALSPGHAQPAWWVLVTLGMIAFSRDRPAHTQAAHPQSSRVQGSAA